MNEPDLVLIEAAKDHALLGGFFTDAQLASLVVCMMQTKRGKNHRAWYVSFECGCPHDCCGHHHATEVEAVLVKGVWAVLVVRRFNR